MKKIKRYCLACDLKDDPKLIGEYKQYHAEGKARPEITESIKRAGVLDMEIYLVKNRLFMIMETGAGFSLERKQRMDSENPAVQEWEALMDKYQQQLTGAGSGEKWVLMDRIFKLEQS